MPEGFAPVAAADAEILILGTMPSVTSLEKRQYYGFGRNAFWPLVYALWDAGEPPEDYEQRLQFLLTHRLALWDVLRECDRQGSADAAIRTPQANDFAVFAAAHPRIRRVFFNSSGAATFYRRLVIPDPFAHCPKHTLPSSSPARAMPFAEKLRLWRPLREAAENGR